MVLHVEYWNQVGGWGACVECEIFCCAVIIFFRCYMLRLESEVSLSFTRARTRVRGDHYERRHFDLAKGPGFGFVFGPCGLGVRVRVIKLGSLRL